jgi:hypothetical protein
MILSEKSATFRDHAQARGLAENNVQPLFARDAPIGMNSAASTRPIAANIVRLCGAIVARPSFRGTAVGAKARQGRLAFVAPDAILEGAGACKLGFP